VTLRTGSLYRAPQTPPAPPPLFSLYYVLGLCCVSLASRPQPRSSPAPCDHLPPPLDRRRPVSPLNPCVFNGHSTPNLWATRDYSSIFFWLLLFMGLGWACVWVLVCFERRRLLRRFHPPCLLIRHTVLSLLFCAPLVSPPVQHSCLAELTGLPLRPTDTVARRGSKNPAPRHRFLHRTGATRVDFFLVRPDDFSRLTTVCSTIHPHPCFSLFQFGRLLHIGKFPAPQRTLLSNSLGLRCQSAPPALTISAASWHFDGLWVEWYFQPPPPTC